VRRIEHHGDRGAPGDRFLARRRERRAHFTHRGANGCSIPKGQEPRGNQREQQPGDRRDERQLEKCEGAASHEQMEPRRPRRVSSFCVVGTISPQIGHHMRSTRLLFICATAAVAACGNPRAEANTAQALNDAAAEINGLKNDLAQLQTEMDSLRTVLIKQDSTISRIAAVNNIPISR
jgi:hypothetical protein